MTTQTEAERLAQEFADAHQASTPGTWKKGRTTHHTVTDNNYAIGEFHHAADAQFCDTAHKLAVPIVSELLRLEAANAELQLARTVASARLDEFKIENAMLAAANAELLEALKNTWEVLESAGLLNLSNGVQLGPTSWYVKAASAQAKASAAIAKHQPPEQESTS